MKKFSDFIKSNLLTIVIALQPALDILSYFQRNMSVSFAGFFRLALTVLIPLYALIFTKERKKLLITIGVITAFCCLHILNGFRVGYINFFLDVKYMLLVCHAILLCFSFMFLYEKEDLISQIKNALKIVVSFVAITYYLSYFLKSGSHTYIYSQLGWTGWNNTPSVFSVILSALFPFTVYLCVKSGKKRHLFFLLPLSFMYILNGTKATYLTMIFTLLGYAVFVIAEYFINKKGKFPAFVSVFLVCVLLASVAYYNYSPRFTIDLLNDNNIAQTEELLSQTQKEDEGEEDDQADSEEDKFAIDYFLDKRMIERFGRDRVISAYEGHINPESLSNIRLKKIIFGSLVWEETDPVTKFVGFEQALMYIGENTYDLESDAQAIYFYYGYIGALLYGALLVYFWLRLIKQLLLHFKESFNLFNFTIFLTYALLMLSALYTGHLLRRPNTAIYLAIVLLLIYCRTEPLFTKRKQKNEGQNEG